MIKTHDDFDVFLTHWKVGRPNRQADYITFKVGRGTAKKCADQANRLIEKLGLNLSASATPFFSGDSFMVARGDTEV